MSKRNNNSSKKDEEQGKFAIDEINSSLNSWNEAEKIVAEQLKQKQSGQKQEGAQQQKNKKEKIFSKKAANVVNNTGAGFSKEQKQNEVRQPISIEKPPTICSAPSWFEKVINKLSKGRFPKDYKNKCEKYENYQNEKAAYDIQFKEYRNVRSKYKQTGNFYYKMLSGPAQVRTIDKKCIEEYNQALNAYEAKYYASKEPKLKPDLTIPKQTIAPDTLKITNKIRSVLTNQAKSPSLLNSPLPDGRNGRVNSLKNNGRGTEYGK